VSAIRGELGLKTIVVEKDPSSAAPACTSAAFHQSPAASCDVYEHFKNGAELGFEVSGLKINWANIIARKERS